MPDRSPALDSHSPRKLNYGWIIVAAGTLMLAICYGLIYSYSVFFKPLAAYFNWDRATVSLVYSASVVIRGAVAIGVGWLADRYGARKLMVFCGLMIGLGLVLSSQVQTLWQFFVTYAIIEPIGLSGAFGVATAMTSRWFTKNRGLALGIVSSGVGIGTLIMVPGNERLIDALGWSQAFFLCGLISGLVVIVCALFLRPAPQTAAVPLKADNPAKTDQKQPVKESRDLSLSEALRSPRMIMVSTIFALLLFCTQIVIVHLVNYATDIGISSLAAASFVGLVGASSIAGRLVAGAGSDRLGIHQTLVYCCALVIAAMIGLIFTGPLWSFYLFAVVFGFTYGAEVPLIPLFAGRFCGMKAMATLVGLILFIANIGGALGPWIAGIIYDRTDNYHWAFILAAASGLVALILALVLKKQDEVI
jgi:MFS family permease